MIGLILGKVGKARVRTGFSLGNYSSSYLSYLTYLYLKSYKSIHVN
jgi:hypothetical protein